MIIWGPHLNIQATIDRYIDDNLMTMMIMMIMMIRDIFRHFQNVPQGSSRGRFGNQQGLYPVAQISVRSISCSTNISKVYIL